MTYENLKLHLFVERLILLVVELVYVGNMLAWLFNIKTYENETKKKLSF